MFSQGCLPKMNRCDILIFYSVYKERRLVSLPPFVETTELLSHRPSDCHVQTGNEAQLTACLTKSDFSTETDCHGWTVGTTAL